MGKLTRRKLIRLAAPAIVTAAYIRRVNAQLSLAYAPDQTQFNNWFSPQSLFRAKPQGVTFAATGQIQAATNFPGVDDCGVSGSSDSGSTLQCGGVPIYYAHGTDAAMSVAVAGIQDEGSGGRTVSIPHWPKNVFEVPGPVNTTDKEAVIYDSTTGLLHEFWQLTGSGSSWSARSYVVESVVPNNPAWDGGASQGLAIGTASRPYNIRVLGTGPATGGLRLWELFAGTYPKHALIMSLDSGSVLQNSATSGPPPIFPATGQDGGFPYVGVAPNAWSIGQFFMLPSNFNLRQLTEQGSILVAQTLMNYGVYLADTGPGANIFVAEMPDLSAKQGFWSSGPIYPGGPTSTIPFWDQQWSGVTAHWQSDGSYGDATDMKTIQAALKPVSSVRSWLDANGNAFAPTKWKDMNLIGMRGPFTTVSGSPPAAAIYDTAANAFVCPSGSPAFIVYTRRDSPMISPSNNGPWWDWHDQNGWFHTSYSLNEGDPVPGRSYTLKAYGAGNMTVRLIIQDQTLSITYFDSAELAVGQSKTFNWPNQSSTSALIQITNPANGRGRIRLEMVGN